VRKIILITLLVLLISLAGCQFKRETTAEPLGAYIGGTSGLSVDFQENAPPLEVYDENQDEFDIALLLENKGEHDIPPNKVIASLSGIRGEDFGISNLNKVLRSPLDGKTISQGAEVRGSQDELVFEGAKYRHNLKADFDAEILMHTCFQYMTHAITTVCLKRDVLKRTVEVDTCLVNNDVLNMDTSSAPIQVSDAAQASRGKNKIRLTFEVSNDGDGEVYTPTAFTNTCFGKEDERDKVRVKVSSPANGLNIRCRTMGDTSDGIVKLLDGKRSVDCEIDTRSLQEISFETPVQIDVSYFYRGLISQEIKVLSGE